MGKLTHLDESGQARMVDVGDKNVTRRIARASAVIRTRPDVIAAIEAGGAAKGDVLAVARVAGITAAKRTADLIPLCHTLPLEAVEVNFRLHDDSVEISTKAVTTAKTGVEMEALTAASVAALTIYDMCKALDRSMVIDRVQLEEKSGGKSGHFIRTQSK